MSNELGPLAALDGEECSPPPLHPSGAAQDAHALQQVALPCLQYLHHLMQPPSTRTQDSACPAEVPPLDLGSWLAGRVSYADWRRWRAPLAAPAVPPLPGRDERLASIYTARWKDKVSGYDRQNGAI